MKTTKNFLLDLARCIDNGVPDMEDSVLDVITSVVPIIQVFAPHQAPVAPTNIPQLQSSGTSSSFSVIAASGLVNTTILTLSKGLWRFNADICVSSNYTAATAQVGILLNYGNGSIALVLTTPGGAAAAPTVFYAARITDILIPVDGATITIFASNNAAGQSLVGTASIIATKLL